MIFLISNLGKVRSNNLLPYAYQYASKFPDVSVGEFQFDEKEYGIWNMESDAYDCSMKITFMLL